jgi:hypothetical protein
MYQITPTLLDAFARFERHQDEESFNDLINKINRVKSDQTDHQLKGIAFENEVNGIKSDFYFEPNIISDIQSRILNNIGSQVKISAEVNGINFYGIADYVFPEMILDLKGTGNYYYGKFKKKNQFPVYSFIKELNKEPIKQFKYLVSDYVNVYQETYIPTQKIYDDLLEFTGEFIRFINHFKSRIINPAIFG